MKLCIRIFTLREAEMGHRSRSGERGSGDSPDRRDQSRDHIMTPAQSPKGP